MGFDESSQTSNDLSEQVPAGKSELPSIIKKFDKYKIFYWSTAHISLDNPNSMNSDSEAAIYCYLNGQGIGRMIFYNFEPLPASKYIASPWNQLEIVFHINRFNDIINIVRYEKTLALTLNPNTSYGTLSTEDLEPVGEQE